MMVRIHPAYLLPTAVCNMCDDIRDLVNSYNLEDIDAQVDYFRVGFWFHGVEIAGNLVINPKRASRKAKTRKVAC